ncbi:hypothetical protein ACOZ4L_14490 [Haloplanus ruber]|uniref:PGF-CTERM sorting domain-containing protein n=1 Tax=Haloplanus ruber TaxID=869892 RepID=A0ABD6D056_9EURY|nr:hypothetical protein [Haloplanus ruber]
MTHPRHVSILAVTLAALALLGAVATAGTVTAQSEQPTVRVVGDTVAADGTTTVGVVLTNAPNGLAGYYLDITVENPEVAQIEGASYPEQFALTTSPSVGDDGATATLEAADMEGQIDPGATDVTLAAVEISGVAAGETTITVTPSQFDDDDGNAFQPATAAGTVTVDGSGGDTAPASDDTASGTAIDDDGGSASESTTATRGDAGTDDAAETAGSGPLSPALVVVAITALVAVALVRRRR